MNAFRTLNTQGLTNHGSEDFGNYVMSERKRPRAFCTSSKCCKTSRNYYEKTLKENVGNKTDCPDCGSALLWL